MMSAMKAGLVLIAGVSATALPCPFWDGGVQPSSADAQSVAMQAADTSTVRLHISGMTCGSCPATARLALKRLTGVYAAQVTLEDSLGVVKYDPARVTPPQIAAHLTRLTGYRATVLPDTAGRPTGS